MATGRDDFLFLAKISEQAERFDEMVENVKAIGMMDTKLTIEERNLLSVAYKNVVGVRRTAWRVLSNLESKDLEKKRIVSSEICGKFRKSVEEELKGICQDILELLNGHIIPSCKDDVESLVFYHKMIGDYMRYMAEFQSGQEKKETATKSLEAYTMATQVCKDEQLPCTHPIRLGLALNFSVFYYEILNEPEPACALAQSAFDDAIAELDSLSEENYKDSTLIMQLLRDNLTLWKSDTNDKEKEGMEQLEGVDGDN